MPDRIAEALALDPERKRALLAALLREKRGPARPPGPSLLSFGQRRLWLLDRLEPGASTYHVPFAFRIRGALDIPALQRALNAVVRRHDVLRAVVTDVGGEPAHRIDPTFELALPVIELEAGVTFDRLLATESARSFDLTAGPAIRALLVSVGAAEHVLLVTIHHIVVDGWSIGVFNRELAEFYREYAGGAPSTLPALRATYADFSSRQREVLTGDVLERGLSYWREALRCAAPSIDFRTLREGTPRTSQGGVRTRTFDPVLHARLRAFAIARRTTLFSTVLALFCVLLRRYTGQTDLTIGAAFGNRARTEDEALIGFFVNTVPLRARLDGDPTFAAALAGVHANMLAAFDHADIPLERLIEDLQPERSAGRTPLFNVMAVLQNSPDAGLALAGLAVTPVALDRTTAKFDLTLQVVESAGGFTASIEYSTDLFDAATVDGLLAAFETLAGDAVRFADRPISQLRLVDAAAQREQHALWERPAGPLSGNRIETLFERHAARAPDRIAVLDRNERVSYGALNERANRLAQYLLSIGVRSGARIALCLERGSAAVIAMLAVLKTGGAYVPLDPEYPRERLAFMLADSGATAVLTERRFTSRVNSGSARVVALDGEAWRAGPATDPERSGDGNDGAYVMYTSGSTGKPKGVLVAHRGIERLVDAPFGEPISADDNIAHGSTLAFDASTFEIWAALCNGAQVTIVSKAVLLAPDALTTAIDAQRITIMFLTTALFREIVRKAPAAFRALRLLIVGGEALDAESVRLVVAGRPPNALINAYGPTETTTFATYFPIDLQARVPAIIPIGRPLAHTLAIILDDGLQLLPRGACGQLFIGGAGVALGYLNNPELTQAKFIAQPLAGEPPARLYATGDLARYLPSGDIEFAGRIDAQLKVRGFRIEPGEIEAALRKCAGVNDAVVVLDTDAGGNGKLVGYIATDLPHTIDLEKIRRTLRSSLPAHLVPDVLFALSAFPLTAGGKLDRTALPAPMQRVLQAADAAAPVTELHQQLIRIWENLLDVCPVGIRDDFFALGGHSLLAVRLVGEIERAFSLRLPLAVLFEKRTIEQLALVLREDPANLNSSPMTSLNPNGEAAPFFYFHGSLDGGGFYCLELARRMGADRPIHVLRPHGADGGPIPPTIEAVAADALTLITAAQPHGPYRLGGFCSGGLVAFEIAQQLRARGEAVANVVLVDVPLVGRWLRIAAAAAERSAMPARLRVAAIAGLARAARLVGRFQSSRSKVAFLRERRARLSALFARPAAVASDEPATPANTWRTLSLGYVPRRYDGRLTILASEEERRTGRMTPERWLAISSQSAIVPIPGNHLTCITDYIDDTAKTIAAALE